MCATDSQSEEGLMMLGEKGLNSRRLFRMNKLERWKTVVTEWCYLNFLFFRWIKRFWVMTKSRMAIGKGAECHWLSRMLLQIQSLRNWEARPSLGLFISVQFSRSVVADSLQPHESQYARPLCPSPTPGVHSDSRPCSQWCHPVISSLVVTFFSCPQSLPASHLFQWVNS